MTDLPQTPEQLLRREDAAAGDPNFATLEGRAIQDVKDTIAYLAVGLRPKTVLGGLMHSQYALFDSSYLPGNDRDEISIGVSGKVDPIHPNERGDRVIDVLEGLVKLGFVERVFEPGTVDALELPDTNRRRQMNRPTFRLATENLPPEVRETLDRVSERGAEIRARQAQWEEKRARPRRGFFRRKATT